MSVQLLPLLDQVIVITGASSGIGLVTAKLAARAGARVVLAARNAHDLGAAVADIRRDGGRAIHVVADVADPNQVDAVADAAIGEFGRIDTWVNNAAVSMYGRVMQLTIEDMRRQMDVNYWGQVHGSRTAVPHLRNRGGALINVASALADRAIPLQANDSAAKHAVKAFTDSLRMELEEEGAPISVTLVKPQPVPPVYAPEVVADVILHAAQQPIREVIAGGSGVKLRARAAAATFIGVVAGLALARLAFRAHESVRADDEAVQRIGVDAREPHENARIADVVIL